MLDHPNVIKVFEYFDDADNISLIMEKCTGGELQDHIDAVFRHKKKKLHSEEFMADVMKQAFRALAFMHGKKILHKDLKPQNIMLVDPVFDGAASASIKIIDFGLSEVFEKSQ